MVDAVIKSSDATRGMIEEGNLQSAFEMAVGKRELKDQYEGVVLIYEYT